MRQHDFIITEELCRYNLYRILYKLRDSRFEMQKFGSNKLKVFGKLD